MKKWYLVSYQDDQTIEYLDPSKTQYNENIISNYKGPYDNFSIVKQMLISNAKFDIMEAKRVLADAKALRKKDFI